MGKRMSWLLQLTFQILSAQRGTELSLEIHHSQSNKPKQ